MTAWVTLRWWRWFLDAPVLVVRLLEGQTREQYVLARVLWLRKEPGRERYTVDAEDYELWTPGQRVVHRLCWLPKQITCRLVGHDDRFNIDFFVNERPLKYRAKMQCERCLRKMGAMGEVPGE